MSSRGPVNVVIFVIDTLRSDRLGTYGYFDRATSPRIDDLAAQSVVFEQAYAPAPWTLPTVASIFTSSFPCEHQVLHDWHRLDPSFQTLGEALQSEGFLTVSLFGNPYAGARFGLDRGFDLAKSTGPIDGALIGQLLDQTDRSPFFLYLHNVEPHNPYDQDPGLPAEFDPLTDQSRSSVRQLINQYRHLTRVDFEARRPIGTTDNTPEQAEALATLDSIAADYEGLYDGAVRLADQRVGSVIDELIARGLWEETLFILISDHGEELGDHGGWLHDQSAYEELIRVPLIWRFPGDRFAGMRLRQAVSLVDVFPTLLSFLEGEPLPPSISGVDLMPIIEANQAPGPSESRVTGMRMNRKKYFRPWHVGRGNNNVVIRHGTWKGIWNADLDSLELYNLAVDPEERSDVATENPALAEQLQLRAEAWFRACLADSAQPKTVEDAQDEVTRDQLRALGYIQ